MRQLSLPVFADKINEIFPVMIREFARRQVNELYKGKITLPQFLVLELLHRRRELKMTELAAVMDVSTAAMTGIVQRLVRDKYALRLFEPKDRRLIKIRLTPRGNNLVAKINEERRKMVINVFSNISSQDRQDYLRILTRIRDILTKE